MINNMTVWKLVEIGYEGRHFSHPSLLFLIFDSLTLCFFICFLFFYFSRCSPLLFLFVSACGSISLSIQCLHRTPHSKHDAKSENLDASVAKTSCSELEVAKVATEDLGGHGSDIVEQVNHHCRICWTREPVRRCRRIHLLFFFFGTPRREFLALFHFSPVCLREHRALPSVSFL